MVNLATWDRLNEYGKLRLLKSYDIYVSLAISASLYFTLFDSMTLFRLTNLVEASNGLAVTLIPVILTGVAIIVSLSNKEFLAFIQEQDVYDSLMFIFEFTVILAILVSILGISIQSIHNSKIITSVYVFMFLYLLFSISKIISLIIEFGEQAGKFGRLQSLDEAELRERVDEELLSEEREQD